MIYLEKAFEYSTTTTLIGHPTDVINKSIGGPDRCNKKISDTYQGGEYIADRSPILNKKIGYPIDIKKIAKK
jgi:hypothetical protein